MQQGVFLNNNFLSHFILSYHKHCSVSSPPPLFILVILPPLKPPIRDPQVWIEDLQMIGFCGSLPRQHQKEMKLGDFSPKDLVKVKYMSALLDGTLRLLVTMSELVAPGAVR